MRDGKAEKKVLVVLYGLALILLPGLVYPEIPRQINYQGYLTSAQGVQVNENVQMVFAIYDDLSSGTKLWEETHNVNVTRGVYNVILGEGTPSNPVNLPFDTPYYLSVRVGSDPERWTHRFPCRAWPTPSEPRMRRTVGVGPHTSGFVSSAQGRIR